MEMIFQIELFHFWDCVLRLFIHLNLYIETIHDVLTLNLISFALMLTNWVE